MREEARKLLQQAIENEIQELIDSYKDQKDEADRKIVKRNGHLLWRQMTHTEKNKKQTK